MFKLKFPYKTNLEAALEPFNTDIIDTVQLCLIINNNNNNYLTQNACFVHKKIQIQNTIMNQLYIPICTQKLAPTLMHENLNSF